LPIGNHPFLFQALGKSADRNREREQNKRFLGWFSFRGTKPLSSRFIPKGSASKPLWQKQFAGTYLCLNRRCFDEMASGKEVHLRIEHQVFIGLPVGDLVGINSGNDHFSSNSQRMGIFWK
jgi:hypothetical protein